MIKANKWDFKRRKYDPIEIPSDCKAYSSDMEEKVRCPQCGKSFLFGDGYTSKQIHTDIGFGYSVCARCYDQEWKDWKEANNEENK